MMTVGKKSQDHTSLDASPGEITGSSEKPVLVSQLRIIKNLVVMHTGLLLFFTSYNGLSMLQSTMNQNQGIGVASQAIIYAGFCISASMFTKYTIRKLGCKRALLLCMCCYIPYIAANFYFSWIIMVPSAVLVGLAGTVLWSSNSTYLIASAEAYSNNVVRKICEKQNRETSNVNHCVNGQSKGDDTATKSYEKIPRLDALNIKDLECHEGDGNVKCNNIVLYSNNDIRIESKNSNGEKLNGVLTHKTDKNNTVCSNTENYPVPKTFKQELQIKPKYYQLDERTGDERSKIMSSTTAIIFGFAGLAHRSTDIWSNLMSYYILQRNSVLDNLTENGNCSCGAAFCNVESKCFEHNLAEPDPEMRNLLTGISLVLTCVSIIMIFLFLDELETDRKPTKFSFDLLMATCKFVAKKEALFLLPLSLYIGFQQAFYIGDFTKSYIACAWGVYHIGLVTVAYGLSAGIFSTLSGVLVRYVGRMAVILGGGVINASICTYLLWWNPLPDHPFIFFVAAACWGASIGILWSQTSALYGVLFKEDKEVAFAGFYLWDAIGYTISFSYSNYICTYLKIYILLAVSTLGMIGYVRTEMIYKQRTKV